MMGNGFVCGGLAGAARRPRGIPLHNRIARPTTNLEEAEPVWHLGVAAKVTRYILNPRAGVDSAARPSSDKINRR